jgi:hypothetical protein
MGNERGRAHELLLACLLAACWSCSPVFGPSKPDADWRTLDRGHFTFYVRPGSFAEGQVDRFSEVLEDQYGYTLAALSVHYAGRISVFLHDSAADGGFDHDRSGTAYPDTEAVKVVCTGPLDANLYWLLAHEVNHVIIRNGLGRPGTYLVNEGLASAVISERYHQLGRQLLFTWARMEADKIPPVSSLADDSRWSEFDSNVTYKASASFLAYLLDRYGPALTGELYQVKSKDFTKRFSQIYGLSLDQAESDWKRSCVDWLARWPAP